MMMRSLEFIYFLCIYVFIGDVVAEEAPLVKTPLGDVRGRYLTYGNGQIYSSFMSIPYAEPPIGNFRFKSPIFPRKWKGEWSANKEVSCLSGSYTSDAFAGEEDCLYLNIHVPSKNPSLIKNKLPILFSIHGGSFLLGNGHKHNGPLHLLEKNFILVTFNYRLGALGFLSTQDEIVPGNNGLKDQLAALKWVYEYISYFGGNQEEITLIGNSAGGASVHYHMLSPLSKGLFKNAISLSGVALNPWAFQSAPLEQTKKLAEVLNCPFDNNSDLVACLRTKTAKEIVKATHEHFFGWSIIPIAPFTPVVEPNNVENTFINKHPFELMKNGEINDVPWLTTVVNNEGSMPSFAWFNNQTLINHINNNWNNLCPYLYDFNYTQIIKDKNENDKNCLKIKQHYLGKNQIVTKENYELFAKSLSDRLFNGGIKKAALLHAKKKKSPVYTYWFNYTLESVYMLFKPIFPAMHGDDVPLIFSQNKHKEDEINISKNDKEMIEIMTDYVTSFAKNGVPSLSSKKIEWKPVKGTEPINYLYIESPNILHMKNDSNDYFANSEFWEKQIYLNENENLFFNNLL